MKNQDYDQQEARAIKVAALLFLACAISFCAGGAFVYLSFIK